MQKTTFQKVKLQVDVSGLSTIKTVGLRGEEKPLSWDKDLEMKPVVKDSLYEIELEAKTGYLFTEVKFVVNNKFELQDKSNRRIVFDKSGITTYKAKFNTP